MNDEVKFHDRVRRMIMGWQKASGKNHKEMADLLSTSNYTMTEGQYQSYVRKKPRDFPTFAIFRFLHLTGLAIDGVSAQDPKQEDRSKRRDQLIGALNRRRSDREIKPQRERKKNEKSSVG